MKPIISSIFVLLLFSFASAQTKNIKIFGKKHDGIEVEYRKLVDFEKKDTSYFIWITFNNASYSRISDLRFITISDTNTLAQFKMDLLAAFKQQYLKEKASMAWRKEEYTIRLNESNFMLLEDKRSIGYCYLYRKNAERILVSLNRINFGSDQLLPESK